MTASRQTTGGVSYDFPNYSYTLTGDLTAMTLPSGRVVSWTYDALGRRTGASWAKGTETFRTAAAGGFDAGGGVLELWLGEKKREAWAYSAARKQVTEIRLGVTGDTAKDGLWKWEYCPMVGSARVCSANNGNVMEHEIGVGPAGGETQAFSYDRANRLVAAAAGTWSETYGMDALGNLWRAGRTGLPALLDAPSDATWYANGRNRAVPPGAAESTYFDAAGNRKLVAGRTLTYDAEGRVVGSAGAGTASYVFDGLGRRVKTDVGGVVTTLIYDAAGKLAAEYGGPAATEGGVRFVTVDALGSTRALTDAAGTVTWRRDYAPFGEELATANRTGAAYSNAGTRRRFTGKERDAETGLDYFGARYLSAAQGRWTSPDKPFADKQANDPQSWNLYAYVGNNPLKYVDVDGLEKILSIYVQQPKPGTKDAYAIRGGSVEVGHTFIGLRDTEAGEERRVGLYPSKEVNPIAGPVEVPGVIVDDSKHKWDVKQDYTITDQQYDKLKREIDTDKKTPPKYNLNTNNCTDYACKKAASAGIKMPDARGKWPFGEGSNPGKLGEELRKLKPPQPPKPLRPPKPMPQGRR